MPSAPKYKDQNTLSVASALGAKSPTTTAVVTKVPAKPSATIPTYGGNVTGFDPTNAQHIALANAGQDWWTAKQAGDAAGMANAAAQGQQIRAGLQGSTFNPRTGTSTLGTVGTGGFGATEAQNEIQAQIAALNAQLASARSATDYQVGVNNQYLQDQLKGLTSAEAVAGDAAQQLQNRRGGFYSGGLDYQMGGIQRGYADARGDLTRDIAGRNQQLLDQYGTQANNIASQLQQLQSTSPQLIRDRILQYQMQTAPLTGMFQGQQTLDAQNQQFNQQFNTDQFKYQQERDKIADEIDKRNFDEDVRQFGLNLALQRQQEARLSSGGGSSGGSSGGGNVKIPSISTITGNVNKLFGSKNKDTGRYDIPRVREPEVIQYISSQFPDDPQYDDDIEQLLRIYNIFLPNEQQFGNTLQ